MKDEAIKQYALLLRYSDFKGVHTIAEHKKVIDQYGSCWWAKIGKTPSKSYIARYMEVQPHIAFLYTANTLHKCEIIDVCTSQPSELYPQYYDKDIYTLEKKPTVYFRITNLEKVDMELLDEYVVSCSGKSSLYDLKKTISSYYLLEAKNTWRKEEKNHRRRKVDSDKVVKIDPHFCVYKKGNICTNRTCINFQYECERPSMCLKQKQK